jgi:protein ImuA
MTKTKAEIIFELQKELLPLQGFKHSLGIGAVDTGLGPIRYSFPNATFPVGAMHEFICTGPEDGAATAGFISGILSSLMRNGGVSLWISSSQTIFAPSFTHFGIAPDKIIFVNVAKERDVLWCIEEALKCDGLASVIGEINELSFTASRRFQLAVEQNRVTGFIIRNKPRNLAATACIARWKISSLPSIRVNDMPGIGFPRWNVELIKVRNGKTGCWQVEWMGRKFRHVNHIVPLIREVPLVNKLIS